jgi:hypothetical protein
MLPSYRRKKKYFKGNSPKGLKNINPDLSSI